MNGTIPAGHIEQPLSLEDTAGLLAEADVEESTSVELASLTRALALCRLCVPLTPSPALKSELAKVTAAALRS